MSTLMLLSSGCTGESVETIPGGPGVGGDEPEYVPGADPGDPSAVLFDESTIPEFHITLDEDAIDALRVEPREWVEGGFRWEDREFDSVGVRLKGENSFEPIDEKPAFKISFDRYADGGEFLGLEELTLNNMHSDPTFMRERLCYRVFREAGVAAARGPHPPGDVNDEFYGLYANVENVDRRMIRRWFDDEGSMFEGMDVDFYYSHVDAFELEFGPDDRTNLEGVAEAMNEDVPADALAEASDHLDVDQFVLFWAVTAVTGQFDAYPYHYDDFHIYDDPESGVLHFLPWGTDESFQPTYEVTWIGGELAVQCGTDPDCVEGWAWEVLDTLDLVEDDLDWLTLHDAAKSQLEPHIAEDTRHRYSAEDVTDGQEAMRQFMEDRRDTILHEFGLQ